TCRSRTVTSVTGASTASSANTRRKPSTSASSGILRSTCQCSEQGGRTMRLWTFGHGTASADELTELLTTAGIGTVVDVRSAPGSRRNPHMARTSLAEWLPQRGFGYRWDRRLGGFRKLPADSPDTAWRNDSFRSYAAHMRTDEFTTAIDDVQAAANMQRVAVMCSESVWWR